MDICGYCKWTYGDSNLIGLIGLSGIVVAETNRFLQAEKLKENNKNRQVNLKRNDSYIMSIPFFVFLLSKYH